MHRSYVRVWLIVAAVMYFNPDPLLGGDEVFTSDGVKLRYTDQGRGAAVLLVHGYTENIEKAWTDHGFINHLVDAGFRVLALDCRGHGESGKPQTLDSYGLPMVEDLIRLLDHLEEDRAHLVGYSMGAAIVNKLRDHAPDRLLSVTLAAYGTPPLPDAYSDELEKEIRENLKRMNLLEGNDPKALGLLSVQWKEWIVEADALARNRVPCLALIGGDDVFLADTKMLVDKLAHTRLEVIQGDHASARSNPEFLKKLTRFLLSNPLGRD